MLPGSQPRFRKRHPAVKSVDCLPPGSRKSRLHAVRQYPAFRESMLPGSQECRLFATRQSENRAIQDLTVGCQSTTRRSSLGRARGRGPPSDPPPGAERVGGGRVAETLALENLGDVRADAQWIVTARLLYHLHDPVAQPSRMQGIYPRAR